MNTKSSKHSIEQNMEVDANDKFLRFRPRSDFYTGKYIHRGAHLILKNSKGQILVQKRSKNKKWDPDKLSYSAGGTVSKETYKQCVLKETKEEIGIDVKVKRLCKLKLFLSNDKSFHTIYFGISDNKIIIQKREVQYIKWIDEEKLKKDIQIHPEKYTPVFILGLQKYFKMK